MKIEIRYSSSIETGSFLSNLTKACNKLDVSLISNLPSPTDMDVNSGYIFIVNANELSKIKDKIISNFVCISLLKDVDSIADFDRTSLDGFLLESDKEKTIQNVIIQKIEKLTEQEKLKTLLLEDSHNSLFHQISILLEEGKDFKDILKTVCDGLKKIHKLKFADAFLYNKKEEVIKVAYSNLHKGTLGKIEKFIGLRFFELKIQLFESSIYTSF
ncbi:MAG: hypothetical protein C0594_07775, partial [Marinilabiliales bacterium]